MKWIQFWQYGNFFEKHLEMNAGLLFSNIDDLFGFKKDDVVLDIGCASGYFLENIYPFVKEVFGVDISSSYIQACKRKFSHRPRAHFFELDKNHFTDLSFLPTKKVTKVICSSVISYYKDITEVRSLIKNVKKICDKNAMLIIADIIDTPQTISMKNLYSTFLGAIKQNHFLDILSLYWNLLISQPYRKAYQDQGHLYLNYKDLENICDTLSVKITKIEVPITLNLNRLNVCVTFRTDSRLNR